MLNVMLIIAHFAIWKSPNGNNGKNKKSDYYTKNCHDLMI
jgi:hypothetical protein